MSSTNGATSADRVDIAAALALVRNVDDPSQIPAAAKATVEKAMKELWQRLNANTDYVMNDDEFALFNFHRARYATEPSASIGRRATERYWNSKS